MKLEECNSCFRNSIQITWGEIRKRVEGKLRRQVAVVSLAAKQGNNLVRT